MMQVKKKAKRKSDFLKEITGALVTYKHTINERGGGGVERGKGRDGGGGGR